MNTIGDRLSEERKRLRMSQEVFGAHGGVGRGAQINYEANKRSPDAEYLRGISLVGADVSYVITGERGGLFNIDKWRDKLLNTAEKSAIYTNCPHDNELSPKGDSSIREPSPSSLDDRLEKVIDRYIHEDILTTIVNVLHQTLNKKNAQLDEETRTHLIAAAQVGYDKLVAGGRPGKFKDMLIALIDAAIKDKDI